MYLSILFPNVAVSSIFRLVIIFWIECLAFMRYCINFCTNPFDFPSHQKVLKHKVDNIKRMCAHPLMPLYLTGGQDGSVQMWEWGHQQVVCTPRPPGTFAKVTRCRFSQHGNKFGIADGDGNLSLWQASLASQSNRSFFVSFDCNVNEIRSNKILNIFMTLHCRRINATTKESRISSFWARAV